MLKERLNGVQGVESSNLSVPTSKIKGLVPLSKAGLTPFRLTVKHYVACPYIFLRGPFKRAKDTRFTSPQMPEADK